MAQRAATRRQGAFAEQLVASIHDLEHRPDETDWYDAVNPRTGTKYEVKSTHQELESGAPGRFRLWRDQHRSLVASDAAGTAWYTFVLLSSGGDVLDVQRRRPSTVTRLVESWNRAGHGERDGPQYKLPWPQVMDR